MKRACILLAVVYFSSSASAVTQKLNFIPPESNELQQGFVRLQNNNSDAVTVTILGIDDAGITGASEVRLTIPAGASKQFNSDDIELGNSSKGLTGAFGDGTRKWSLNIFSGHPAVIMNLLEAPGGYLSNLSKIANKDASFSGLTCEGLDGARVYSTQEPPAYLGFLGGSFAADSVNNSLGTYGSEFSENGIRNQFSPFGSVFGQLSHANVNSINPPVVVKNGNTLMYLSSNTILLGTISLTSLDSNCSFTSASANDTFATPK